MLKRIFYLTLIIAILMINNNVISLSMFTYGASASVPPKSQSTTKLITSNPISTTPGVYWTQLDNGDFRASYNNSTGTGTKDAQNAGTSSDPYPELTDIPDDVDLTNKIPTTWLYNGKSIAKSLLTDIQLQKVLWGQQDSFIGLPVGSSGPDIISKTVARFWTRTGGSNFTIRQPYVTSPKTKYSVIYYTPVEIYWQGTLTETKQIAISPKSSSVQVGNTTQLTANVSTKAFDSSSFDAGIDVTSDSPASVWTADDTSIVSVSNGLVKGLKAGTTNVRITWTKGSYKISDAIPVTVTTAPTPPTYTITGDFTVSPSTINWRDTFTLTPKNFVIPSACKYQYHEYQFQKNGITWTSAKVTSQTQSTTYTYSSYPSSLGVGVNNITIRITADCADSGWTAGKTLTINTPTGNQAPVFSAGFFKEPDRTGIVPTTSVVIGTSVNLRIINDTSKSPAWPYDPDGDPITYQWLFSSSSSTWIQDIPNQTGMSDDNTVYFNLKTTQLGVQNVTVIARDSFGMETRKTVSINVIPDNPIPIIDGPTIVKENRPLPKPFDGSKSYSPVNRTITSYIWQNKKDVYTTPGTEIVKLDVVDSAGAQSLSPATATLTVLPDDPPVPVVDVQPLGIRNSSYDVFNNSYTTDGDIITSVSYRYRYDSANNGFADDTWVPLAGTMTKATLTTGKVGKYQIELTATEQYGKSASTTTVLDAINQAPSVSFLVEGQNDQPAPSNVTAYSAPSILNSWGLYETNTTKTISDRLSKWGVESGKLVGLLGRNAENIEMYNAYIENAGYYGKMFSFEDYGYGNNGISPYRAMIANQPSYSQPLPFATTTTGTPTYANGWGYSKQIRNITTNPKYVFFQIYDSSIQGYVTYALNKSKIGTYSMSLTDSSGNINPQLNWANGNPYDFIIKPPTSKTIYMPRLSLVGDWNSQLQYYGTLDPAKLYYDIWQNWNFNKVYNQGVKATSRTIYYINYLTMTGSGVLNSVMDIESYDALTGQKIASTAEKGYYVLPYGQWRYFNKGDNLLIYVPGTQGETNIIMEFDRNGNLVNRKSVPIRKEPRIGYNGGNVNFIETADYNRATQDSDGNIYKIYNLVCSGASWDCPNYGAPYEFYVSKIDAKTGARVWDVPLQGNFPWSWPFCPQSGIIYSCAVAKQTEDAVSSYIVMNEKARQIIIRHYSQDGFGHKVGYQYINMDTGASGPTGLSFTTNSTNFYIDQNGTYQTMPGVGFPAGGTFSYTADGNMNGTMNTMGPGGNYSWSGGGIVAGNNFCVTMADTSYPRVGFYIGDGLYLTMYTQSSCGSSDHANLIPWITKGTPTGNPLAFAPNELGQFVSPETLDSAEFNFTMNMKLPKNDTNLAGLSFRMTDPRNRYAVETDGSNLYLSKYVNGTRTVLKNMPFNFNASTDYTFKVMVEGDRIQVFVGGVPYFDTNDSTYTSGKFGPFSTKPYTEYSNINRKMLSTPTTEWLTNFALWDSGTATADVRVSNLVFSDPENDPRAGNNQWTITHTPKFLNNQGLSALDGKTFTSPVLQFDKVGNYLVKLKAEDDPNPSYLFPSNVFDEYRKWSNEYWQMITVHRRPIAQYSLSFASDKSIVWNDTSYDPDRYQSSTVYDTEATGINYQTTRGILERKYYYTTPSGTRVNEKLVTPQETGTYLVGLQVKDEYGAWSNWNEQSINISVTVAPDQPPVPGFNLSATTVYRGDVLTITSTATDKEDGASANLAHEYYIKNKTNGGAESLASTNRTSWTKTFGSLGVYEIRQVVCDSKGQCSGMIKQVSVVNRGPTADFDWTPKPVWEGDDIKLIDKSTDPDGDPLTYSWSFTGPSGFNQTSTVKNPTIDGANVKPGTYTIQLTVSDGQSGNTVSKTITVNALTVQGQVKHTTTWEQNRLTWNAKNPASPRNPNVFWAGERFELIGTTTDTGASATKAVSVQVAVTEIGSTNLTKQTAVQWTGHLGSDNTVIDMEDLDDGTYSFVFTATYSNGVIKKDTVTAIVSGNWNEFYKLHRIG